MERLRTQFPSEHSARELPTWIAILRSGWTPDVLTAAGVLERLGSRARDALPALREAIDHERLEPVKERLREVLRAIEAE